MKRLTPVLSALSAVALTSALFFACLDRGDNDAAPPKKRVTQVQQPEDALDEQLMVTLLEAKNFHHKANVYEMNGELDKAVAEIRKVLTIKFPADAPEAAEAVLDARARLAKLLMKLDKLDEAEKVVATGIKSAKSESFFLANLYTVAGQLHEARANKLKDSTTDADRAAFKEHSRKAIEAFDKSIKINEAIQKRLMKGMAP